MEAELSAINSKAPTEADFVFQSQRAKMSKRLWLRFLAIILLPWGLVWFALYSWRVTLTKLLVVCYSHPETRRARTEMLRVGFAEDVSGRVQLQKIWVKTQEDEVIDALIGFAAGKRERILGRKRPYPAGGAWVLYIPGQDGNYDTAFTGKFLEGRPMLHSDGMAIDMIEHAGLNVLAINYPGAGRSTGFPTRDAILRFIHTALEFLENPVDDGGVGASSIVVWGYSLGGAMSLEAFSEHARKPGIRYAIVNDRSFARFTRIAVDTAQGLLKKTAYPVLVRVIPLVGWALHPFRKLKTVPDVPAFLMYHPDDPVVPFTSSLARDVEQAGLVSETRQVLRLDDDRTAGKPTERSVLNAHSRALYGDEWDKILLFLKKHATG